MSENLNNNNIELGEYQQNDPLNIPPQASEDDHPIIPPPQEPIIKVDMSEMVTAINEFNTTVKYKGMGYHQPVRGIDGSIVSVVIAVIFFLILIFSGSWKELFIQLIESNKVSCNCNCNFPTPKPTMMTTTNNTLTTLINATLTTLINATT